MQQWAGGDKGNEAMPASRRSDDAGEREQYAEE
jgi:hypothetical protein